MINKYSEVCVKSHGRVTVGFTEAKHIAMAQIDLREFEEKDRDFAYELIIIIAEVYSLPPACSVKIGGEKLSAGTVGEVYGGLGSDHLKMCIENFRNVSYEIKHRKSYFRTALYNSLFEFESYCENAAGRYGLK